MKLNKKMFLSLSSVLTVSIPMATVIACSDISKKEWDSTGSNFSSTSSIDINPKKDFIFEGEDGKGIMTFKDSGAVIGMLSQANAKLTIELARYKNSTILKDNYDETILDIEFSKINKIKNSNEEKIKFINSELSKTKNLSVEDKIRVKIETEIKGYKIKDIAPLVINQTHLTYDPLKPSQNWIALDEVTLKNGTLNINLDKYKDNNLNDALMSIMNRMGMLLSPDLDMKLGNSEVEKAFTPRMVFNALISMHAKGVEHIKFSYTDKDGKNKTDTFDFEEKEKPKDPKNLLNTVAGKNILTTQTLLEKLKTTIDLFEPIFNPATASTKPTTKNKETVVAETDISKVDNEVASTLQNSAIWERYIDLLKLPKGNDVLLLMANMWDKPNKDTKALDNLTEVLLAYSNIFKKLKEWKFFKEWIETVRFRNLDKLDSIVFSTILRK